MSGRGGAGEGEGRHGPSEDLPAVCPGRRAWEAGTELPPLHAVLDGLDGVRLLIVDGYADLDPGGRPGLGAHACAEFGVPVIGVAKTAFRPATHAVPVVRGERSARPLFVTAAGCPAIRPQTWSATWQAATGYPTLFAAPTLWPAATRPDPDALATDMLIAADPDSSAMLRTGSAVTPIQTAAPGAC